MSGPDLRVAAPPPAVFDYLAEPRHRPQWQPSLRAVEVLTDGPTGVGTRWRDRTMVGAAPYLEITAMEPPAEGRPGSWAEIGRWRGLEAGLTLSFRPVTGDPAATDVSVGFSVTGGGPWRVPARVLRLLARPAVRSDLRRAGRMLEARHTS